MPTVDQRIPMLLAMATGLAMLATTGWQGYRFWQAEAGRTPVAEARNTIPKPAPSPRVPDVSLAELRLFGNPQSVQAQPGRNTENLPETNLSLVLRGALAGSGDYPASALIEGPEGDTEVYLAGERLPGNARLKTVLPNRIIIERGGELENLYFPQTDATDGINPIPDNQTTAETIATPADRQTTPTRNAATGEPDRREEIRRRLEERRQQSQENN